jgi:hypothetical protein
MNIPVAIHPDYSVNFIKPSNQKNNNQVNQPKKKIQATNKKKKIVPKNYSKYDNRQKNR